MGRARLLAGVAVIEEANAKVGAELNSGTTCSGVEEIG